MDSEVIRATFHNHFRLHCSIHGRRSGNVHLDCWCMMVMEGVKGLRRHIVMQITAIWLGYGVLSGRSSERR